MMEEILIPPRKSDDGLANASESIEMEERKIRPPVTVQKMITFFRSRAENKQYQSFN